tara:strand:+ start:896 stop:1420 length:525 start_codon:yes stop_codon:yes gene_type:complete
MSSKIFTFIQKEFTKEKVKCLSDLKSFLEEKIDGDFDQISDFIDEFSQSISISKKKTKKPSYYNDWVGNFIKEYKQGVENGENKEVSNTDYMKLGSAAWQKFKESDDFLKEKSKWEKKNSNKIETKQSKSTKSTKNKKSKKKSTKKSNDSDNDSTTDDDINITNINTSDDSDSD